MPCARYIMISIGNDLELTRRTELVALRASPSIHYKNEDLDLGWTADLKINLVEVLSKIACWNLVFLQHELVI